MVRSTGCTAGRSAGQAPNPAAPVVQKLRLRFAKRGRARFASHRDVARCFEWALRRAGLPVALSHGFSPHPRLSWVGAAPTGASSEAEYVEISLAAEVDPAVLAAELDAALPDGLRVLEAVVAGPGGLPERIDASRWRIEVPGVATEDLRRAVAALLAAESVQVERLIKGERREVDVRAALAGARVEDRGGDGAMCGILTLVVRQSTPAVRPDDVLSALRVIAGLQPPVPAKATRTAQGRLDDDGVLTDPLAADRLRDPVGGYDAGQVAGRGADHPFASG